MHNGTPQRRAGARAAPWPSVAVPGNVQHVTVERRKPLEVPVDPDITEELRAADSEARAEAASRGAELLERLRKL